MAQEKKIKRYLSSQQIDSINDKLAQRISSDYQAMVSASSPLLVIVTLKGAMFFAADLLRKLSVPVCIDFVRLASYGADTKSSGTVRFLKDLEMQPAGRHVLVLDEIVDTGRTLDFLVNRVRADSPRSLKVCALLSKPSRREINVNVDYVGLEIEDKFVIGYGLDLNESYRSLPDINYLE